MAHIPHYLRKKKTIGSMTIEELRSEVLSLRKSVAQLKKQILEPKVAAVDRNGKKYNRAELLQVFERLFHENPKAIQLMFPAFTMDSISHRAQKYGLTKNRTNYLPEEDDVIRNHWPDTKKIAKQIPRRDEESIKSRAFNIGLGNKGSAKLYTPEEDALIYKSMPVPGRTTSSLERRRRNLGANGNILKAVNKLGPGELLSMIEQIVMKSYPAQIRQDAVQLIVEWCLEGKCWPREKELKEASKKAITQVYKLHPDRGAPTSLDAKLFDDSDATVGDRISSDIFRF